MTRRTTPRSPAHRLAVILLSSLALVATTLQVAPPAIAATQTSPITYVYDELGRLEAVVDPSAASSQVAKFTYDAVGNLTQIARSSITTTPSVIDFHSHRAAIGATVTVYGTGFSTTPSQNKVTFTGAAAVNSVTATTTTLTVVVPAAATTGPIKVKNTATNKTSPLSSQSWAAPAAAPTITSISTPLGGNPPRADLGTVVTINGTGFAPQPENNVVRVNFAVAQVLTASATQITAKVPDLGIRIGSGPVTVRTQNGVATSAQPLVLMENGIDPFVFDQVYMWSSNQSGSVTFNPGEGEILILFPATQGQQIFRSAGTANEAEVFTPLSTTPGEYQNQGGTNPLGGTAQATQTGTYALLVSRASTAGSLTTTVNVQVSDTSGYGLVDPSPTLSFSIPRDYSGQFSPFQFQGTKDRVYCIDTVKNGGNSWPSAYLYSPSRPDGEVIGHSEPLPQERALLRTLEDLNFAAPETGVYTVVIHGTWNTSADEPVTITDAGVGGSCPAGMNAPEEQSQEQTDQGNALEAVEGFEPRGPLGWAPGNDQSDWVTHRDPTPMEDFPPLQAAEGVTALAGQVLTLDGAPLAGVSVRAGNATAETDETGRFLVEGIPPGRRVVFTVDARGASTAEATYGIFQIGADIERGITNDLSFTIWEPALDVSTEVHLPDYPLEEPVAITNPDMPGFVVRIPAGSRIVNEAGEEVHDVTLTPVPLDRPPFPGPEMNQFTMHFTLQPGDAMVEPYGFRVIYANNLNLGPGFTGNVWTYEPDEGWETYGTATVTQDGTQVRPAPGVYAEGFQGASMSLDMLAEDDVLCGLLILGSILCSLDPVDLESGLFDYQMTDLVEPGTPGLSLTRYYRQNDATTYSAGLSMATNYDLLLNSSTPTDYAYVSLPGQQRVVFEPVNGEGTGAPMVAVKGPAEWLGAYLIKRSPSGTVPYEIRRRDGTWFTFAGPGGTWLSNIRDRFGNEIVIARNNPSAGILGVLALPSGRWIDFERTHPLSARVITSATDSAGRTVTYEYTSTSPVRLLSVTDPAQQGQGTPKETTYGWNPDTSLCSTGVPCTPSPGTYLFDIHDRLGNPELHLDYDTQGRVTQQIFANGGTFTFDYDASVAGCSGTGFTRVVDPVGSVTCARLDGGADDSVIRAQGSPQEMTTTFTLDPDNDSAATLEESFLVSGNQHTRRTDYVYDPLGNVSQISRLANTGSPKTWTFTYSPGYNGVTKITDPLAHDRDFTYSYPTGCLTRAEDDLAKGLTMTCTAAGAVKTLSSDLGASPTTTFSYTSGDLMKVTDPLGNATSRFVGSDGNVRAVTDPTGYQTVLSYDLLGQLTKVSPVSGSSTSFSYDAQQNLTGITLDATGAATQYAYDEVNLVEARTDPLSRQETFAYDAAGRLTRWTDRRGKVTKYCTDDAGNVELIGYGYTGGGQPTCGSSFASTTAFTYDGAGRLGEVVDSISGTITRTYDDLDRMTNETSPQGSLSYTFDDANRRQTLTVAGQPTIDYNYFTNDQLKTITRGTNVVDLTYDAANRLDTTMLPNGVVEDWTYNQANQITGVSWAKAGQASLGALSYGNDAAGRRTNVWGASSRLTLPAATTSNPQTYDLASQLKTWNGQTLTYDQNGNLTGHGTQTYTWDDRNQLASTSGGSSSFAYDGLGRRFSKTVSGATTRYLYDGANVVQELDAANAPTFNLMTGFAPDQIFWRQGVSGGNTVTNSLLHDGLGSTVATTTPAATPAIRDSFTYEPFGKPSSTAFPYLFTGRDYDTATGMQYNRARYMAPAYGRFTAEDPIGIFGGSASSYLYAGNTATVDTDPSGLLFGILDPQVAAYFQVLLDSWVVILGLALVLSIGTPIIPISLLLGASTMLSVLAVGVSFMGGSELGTTVSGLAALGSWAVGMAVLAQVVVPGLGLGIVFLLAIGVFAYDVVSNWDNLCAGGGGC